MSPYEELTLHCDTYAQVYYADDMFDNDMSPRIQGTIALGVANKRIGCHYFLNLSTGKVISRKQYYTLPTTNEVIKRVEQLAKIKSQPIIKNWYPHFERNINGDMYE